MCVRLNQHVEPQPYLQERWLPGSNTADNARADVSARSIWNPLKRAFLDVRVYHGPRSSSLQKNLKTISRMNSHHEEQKKRAYNARILEVERGVFTPIVFSISGGMEEEANTLFRDGSTGGCGGGGWKFLQKCVKKTKVLLKNEGKIVIQEKSFACGEQLS